MLAGFLSVLKIIGIVLLIILAVVLLILLLVLFVPVFYRIDGKIPETPLKEFDVKQSEGRISFSWLWFVLRGALVYPDKETFVVKICGIKVIPKKEKPSKEEKKEDTDKAFESNKANEAEGTVEKSDMGALEDKENEDKAEDISKEPEQEPEDSSKDSSKESKKESDEWTGDEEPDEDEPKSFLDVLWNIFDAIDNFLKTPLNVFEKIQYTISRVCDKIDMVKSTLENDIFKRAFELVKRKLIRIIKAALPRKCDIRILFGSDDPALTAELMGAYGALYPVLYKKVVFTPDFEREVIKADAHLKGHITLFTVIFSAAVSYFNKDVQKTIRRFKKILRS